MIDRRSSLRQITSLPGIEGENLPPTAIGRPIPETRLAELLRRAQLAQQQEGGSQVTPPPDFVPFGRDLINRTDVPFWAQALSTATAPLRWIDENVTQPFAAFVTDPFTPSTPESADLPFFERQRAEYNAWEEPTWNTPWGYQFRPTKGLVETLPWLAVPSVAGVAGRLAGVTAKGVLGTAARAGGAALKPLGALEQLPARAIGKLTAPLSSRIRAVASKLHRAIPEEKIAASLEPKTGQVFETTVYRGSHKLEGLGKAAEFGNAPFGYHTENEIIAKAYASGKPTKELAGEALEAEIKKAGGKITSNRVRLENPYVVSSDDFLDDDIIKPILERARDRASARGADQYEAMARAIPRELKKAGYDGLVVKNSDGFLEVIPYKKEALTRLSGRKSPAVAKAAASEADDAASKTIKEVAGEPPKPPKPPKGTATGAMPDGLSNPQQSAVDKLNQLVKRMVPLNKDTQVLYREERAIRAARYADEVERLTRAGYTPEEALSNATKAMYGKLPRPDLGDEVELLRNALTPDDVQQLYDIILKGTYGSEYHRINTVTALTRLLENDIPARGQIAYLENTFGSELASSVLKQRPFWEKVGEAVLDIANAPRALLASGDLSGLLRQGGVISASSPGRALKTMRPMIKAMLSDENELAMAAIRKARPHYELGLKYGLYMAPEASAVSTTLNQFEEAFMSRFMNKIGFVRASNRAYSTGLNELRSMTWENTIQMWKKAGLEITDVDYTDLAKFINWATGRGDLPSVVRGSGGLLSTLLFSPKLIMSRLQLPTAMLPRIGSVGIESALVRKEATKTLLKAVGTGAGLVTLAQFGGASKLVLDPRSADFGKIRIGNTRLDIWTGYAQYMRFAAQLATGKSVSTQSGRPYTVNRAEIISRFAQSKFSPALGLFNDLLKGETFLGEEMPPKSAKSVMGQVWERMAPLAVQDLVDGLVQDGASGGILASSGFLGVGVVTYQDEAQREREKAAQAAYGISWDEVGQKFGRATQLRLEQSTPAIIEAEQEQERRFATGTPSTMEQWQNEGKAIEEVYRDLIDKAVKQVQATNDWVQFKDKADEASSYRRRAYASRAQRPEYGEIVSYYDQPLPPYQAAQINPGDLARREYYKLMFGADMYDQFGDYRFEEAEKREQDFAAKYGQNIMNYIEEYQGSRWIDKPSELQLLENARETLRPYWQVESEVWSRYGTELKVISDQIRLMERTDPSRARATLKAYPTILRAREEIALRKKYMRQVDREVDRAYRLFYSG